MPCTQCGSVTVWDDYVNSEVCVECGTLVDPTQYVLRQHEPDTTTRADISAFPRSLTLLKSNRKSGWDLAGQSKEARAQRSQLQTNSFIHNIAMRVNAEAVYSRAIHLFARAAELGKLRMTRRRNLSAGACVALALRERSRPDCSADIAFLLKERPCDVLASISEIQALLHLELKTVDMSVHISALHTHFAGFLADQDIQDTEEAPLLPASVMRQCRCLDLNAVVSTASSIIRALDHLSCDHPLRTLAFRASACAVLILAIEAHLRVPLSNASALAKLLATKFALTDTTVMKRYRLLQDVALQWIDNVEWLQKYGRATVSDQSRRTNIGSVAPSGKGAAGKRLIIARGLLEAIQYHHSAWQRQNSDLEVPTDDALSSSVDDVPSFGGDDPIPRRPSLQDSNVEGTSSGTISLGYADGASQLRCSSKSCRPSKRQRTAGSMADAARFLVNPLSSSVPRCTASGSSNHENIKNTDLPSPSRPRLPYALYILTQDKASTSTSDDHVPWHGTREPTRLQLLCARRGGADAVCDDELFAPNELEGLFRSEEEQRVMLHMLKWDVDECSTTDRDKKDPSSGPDLREDESQCASLVRLDGPQSGATAKEAAQHLQTSSHSPRHVSRRLNIDALEQFFASRVEGAEDDKSDDDEDDETEEYEQSQKEYRRLRGQIGLLGALEADDSWMNGFSDYS
ncbi:hypothetical protein FISHEDRAFT_57119 [Fistulina hepatica ATCC 64428]|nr:hypothetical protein FISHEDRAFT_57119 [Fistulina hepatica ATCC 64428]